MRRSKPFTRVRGLHHLYRAMAFLGEPLPAKGQLSNGPVRCTKDLLEEVLFDRRRDLFTEVELVFFDTTSLYFEGEGGETSGERGHNKDHRPDLGPMVVGLAYGRNAKSTIWLQKIFAFVDVPRLGRPYRMKDCAFV